MTHSHTQSLSLSLTYSPRGIVLLRV